VSEAARDGALVQLLGHYHAVSGHEPHITETPGERGKRLAAQCSSIRPNYKRPFLISITVGAPSEPKVIAHGLARFKDKRVGVVNRTYDVYGSWTKRDKETITIFQSQIG